MSDIEISSRPKFLLADRDNKLCENPNLTWPLPLVESTER